MSFESFAGVMGGYIHKPAQGPPGVRTIWRGIRRLDTSQSPTELSDPIRNILMAYNEGVAPGWLVVARWAESQCFSRISRVRRPVWFATLPDHIRDF